MKTLQKKTEDLKEGGVNYNFTRRLFRTTFHRNRIFIIDVFDATIIFGILVPMSFVVQAQFSLGFHITNSYYSTKFFTLEIIFVNCGKAQHLHIGILIHKFS